jgi:hypothetical protein
MRRRACWLPRRKTQQRPSWRNWLSFCVSKSRRKIQALKSYLHPFSAFELRLPAGISTHCSDTWDRHGFLLAGEMYQIQVTSKPDAIKVLQWGQQNVNCWWWYHQEDMPCRFGSRSTVPNSHMLNVCFSMAGGFNPKEPKLIGQDQGNSELRFIFTTKWR